LLAALSIEETAVVMRTGASAPGILRSPRDFRTLPLPALLADYRWPPRLKGPLHAEGGETLEASCQVLVRRWHDQPQWVMDRDGTTRDEHSVEIDGHTVTVAGRSGTGPCHLDPVDRRSRDREGPGGR
jgi:hypothetical protein